MKKQILFLAMITLALIFAGTSNVFGQVVYKDYIEGTVGCEIGIPLTCAGSVTSPELNPTPGVVYQYEIDIDTDDAEYVHWFVTDQATIINGTGAAPVLQTVRDADGGGGTYILDAEDNPVYNNTLGTNTQKTINISWKNFDGEANKVLLVAYVKGKGGCTDNVEVWRIQPVFSFTLDILSMFDNGDLGTKAVPASECVSPVESAVLNAAGDGVTMNYGQNWVFFSVTAANFNGSWKPIFDATAGTGTVGTVQWAYPSEAEKTTGGTWNASGIPVKKFATSVTDSIVGQTGECIVVRVQVTHAAEEAPIALAVNPVTLTINGTMFDPVAKTYTNTTLQDLDEPATAGDACVVDDTTDTGIYNITARPDINEVNPAPASFVPKI